MKNFLIFFLIIFSSCIEKKYLKDVQINTKKIFKIKMLNKSEIKLNDFMTFEPYYLEVQPNSYVHFILTDKGHGSKSLSIPEGATNWNSGLNQEIKLALKNEGYYLYECKPHNQMGMVGLIKVGKPTKLNMEKTKKELIKLRKKTKINQKRIDSLIELVK